MSKPTPQNQKRLQHFPNLNMKGKNQTIFQ